MTENRLDRRTEPAPMDVHGLRNGTNRRNTKIRITIHLDKDIVSYFKRKSALTAKRYQTLINDALREYTGLSHQPGVISDLMERVKRLEQELLMKTF